MISYAAIRHRIVQKWKRTWWLGMLLLASLGAHSQAYRPNWHSLDQRPIPQWFDSAKFGIFIHWGVYSVPAWAPTGTANGSLKYAEWYQKRLTETKPGEKNLFRAFHDSVYGARTQYADFVSGFTAEMFDPAQWADIFVRSGAKYVVLTAKHHDGFALWPSPQSWNWNSMDVGPHRDLAGAVSQAVRSRGLHMGFYYSLYEWFNPLYLQDTPRYVREHMIPQMKDLVTRYHPDILWTDGEWEHSSKVWHSEEFLAWLFNESPVRKSIVVNDRWGSETRSRHGGFYTTEYHRVHGETASAQINHKWEECRGIGGSFGYNRNERLDDYTSPGALVALLIQTVSHGGNLLLDVGPTADGRIPVIMEERLTQMGQWLKINGEAIYATSPWWGHPDPAPGWYFTRRGNTLYLLGTSRPQQQITIHGINASGKIRATFLATGKPVSVRFRHGTLYLDPPNTYPDDPANHYAYVFKIEGATL